MLAPILCVFLTQTGQRLVPKAPRRSIQKSSPLDRASAILLSTAATAFAGVAPLIPIWLATRPPAFDLFINGHPVSERGNDTT